MNPLSVTVRRTPPGVGCRRTPVRGGLACFWFAAMLSSGLASCAVTAPVLSRPAVCVEPIEVVDQVDDPQDGLRRLGRLDGNRRGGHHRDVCRVEGDVGRLDRRPHGRKVGGLTGQPPDPAVVDQVLGPGVEG
ncbi:MAG: hypothetical protein QF464_13540, partial [Myxococcota bacterium]|nr:hypothetical protein [Myxococcota bacterium]